MNNNLFPDGSNFIENINGRQTGLWILQNEHLACAVTNYGARIVSLLARDAKDDLIDVALGYNSVDGYIHATDPYYGAIVGRYANRIANAAFILEGKRYQLPANDGANILHGGANGFHRQVWAVRNAGKDRIDFHHFSPDGEEGFPGNMEVSVSYELFQSQLRIHYTAITDITTIINLSNHTYFNLNGEGTGTINNHTLFINADGYTPIDSGLIPTGEIDPVTDTPFDFTMPRLIGARLHEKNEQLTFAGGYDHNFILGKKAALPDLRVSGDISGIVMEVYSGQPGVQLYGGNAISGKDMGKRGVLYKMQDAFVVEPQHFPDSPNHPGFPPTILKAGTAFRNTSAYKFDSFRG